MKKLSMFLGMLLLFSCNRLEEVKVEGIASRYLVLAKNGEYEKLESFCTKETYQNITMIGCYNPDGWGLIHEVKDIKCIVDKNKAKCSFCCANDPYSEGLFFVKKDGKWLVHLPKEIPSGWDDAGERIPNDEE